ncbi:MAG: OmpA family protein [Putridiphycobacter sp.]|nr:OmpA family protein [Putridiphycobacter sp.]
MRLKRAVFFFVFIFCVTSTGLGQLEEKPIEDISTKQLKGFAKNAMRLGDGYTALHYYLEWAKRKPKNTDVTFQVAELYRYTRNYAEAEIWYSKITKSHAQKYPTAVFYLAEMQVAQEKYSKAKENYLIFKKLARYVDDIYYRDQYKNGLLTCDYALSMTDSIPMAVVTNLPKSINKPHVEFSPVVLDENTIIFGSLNVEGLDYYNLSAHDSMEIPLRKFYIAKKIGNEWINQGELMGPFNTYNAHVGNAAISENKDKIYFTICHKNWKNETVCELYFANKLFDKWAVATKMNESINLPNYTTTQPAIGYDSRTNAEVLYFVSNRPGGKGGLDLWYTEYNTRKKEFKTPKNMGAKLNGRGDEVTPYYDRSTRTLYFSSNGRMGYGGYDVYKTSGEKRRWNEIEILGKGINSSYDDFDFVLNIDKSGGFFVSNRPGGTALLNETCCDDIYEFKFSKFIKIDLKGKLFDESNEVTDYQINVYLKDSLNDHKVMVSKNAFSYVPYNFGLDQGYTYIIEAVKKGYYKQQVEISTKEIVESTTLVQDFYLKKIPLEPVVLKGVLYEFDSDKLTPSAKITIDTTLLALMIDQPNIVVQISSHTDSKGKAAYNMDLSNRRAKSVVTYLTDKGIPPNRLKYKGYGETSPIAPNEFPDGRDNPAGRQLNRRTEFLVVGELDFEILYEDLDESKKERYKRKKNVQF